MNTDNTPVIKMEIRTICDAVSQLLKVYDDNKRGKSVVFASDYSLISGFVRIPRTSNLSSSEDAGFDRNIDHTGRRIFHLYNEHKEFTPYKIAFSEPTIMEFSRSTGKVRRELMLIEKEHPNIDDLYDAFMRYIEGHGSLNSSFGNLQLYHKAKQTFDLFGRVFDKKPLEALLTMIQQKNILGLGSCFSKEDFDLIKPDVYKHTHTIWKYLNENRRVGANQYFNNLIDAINFSMMYFLNKLTNKINISYTAPFPENLKSIEINEFVKQRSIPAALLLDLSARSFVSESSKSENDVQDWIVTCYDRAQICRGYLSNVDSLTKISDSRKREINFFYKDYMMPTFKDTRKTMNPADAFKEAQAFFSNKETFKRRFKEGESLAAEAEVALQNLEPLIGSDELLSDLNLMDDPQIQAIRRRIDYTP